MGKLGKDIQITQRKLMDKVRREGLPENFGHNEVRNLKDKYKYPKLVHGTQEERGEARRIDYFEEWCMNFDPSTLVHSLGGDHYLDMIEGDCGYLYRGKEKLSDELYRAGFFTTKFKDGFCRLYKVEEGDLRKDVIVDEEGKICLETNSFTQPIYHKGGVIAKVGHKYYNLRTQEVIIEGYDKLESNSFIFVENKFNKDYQEGVHKIEKATGNVEVFN